MKYLAILLFIYNNTLLADELVPDLKYIKQAGLANAASKIYTADQKFSFSGFGEINGVHYTESKNRSGELESYYTNLYRSGTYFGYKFTDRIIFNSDFQFEFIHDGVHHSLFEANIEAMIDFLIHPKFNLRVGNYPLPIGYVNINEEPIAFYTVNRPEVERLIIPSQWVEPGVMFYGNLSEHWEYSLGITKGLDAQEFRESTWARDGRFMGFDRPANGAFNGQIKYDKENELAFALSGYTGTAGHHNAQMNPRLNLVSSYLEWTLGQWQFFTLLTRGSLSQTEQLYQVSGQVMGSQVKGHYSEIRYDINPHTSLNPDWKIPLFIRYERLDTHGQIDPALMNLTTERQDLEIITLGVNIRPKRNLVFKGNFQFRKNHHPNTTLGQANQLEIGFGFIY